MAVETRRQIISIRKRDSRRLSTTARSCVRGVKFVSREQGADLLDRQARKYLGMSGQDFVQSYRAGTIEDPDRPEVVRVSMLIPFGSAD